MLSMEILTVLWRQNHKSIIFFQFAAYLTGKWEGYILYAKLHLIFHIETTIKIHYIHATCAFSLPGSLSRIVSMALYHILLLESFQHLLLCKYINIL